jgi:hypothetical protein
MNADGGEPSFSVREWQRSVCQSARDAPLAGEKGLDRVAVRPRGRLFSLRGEARSHSIDLQFRQALQR